jgi:phenylpropionate dioxygenase-like ring-hydroxylating dioxygenase large terminal subunit
MAQCDAINYQELLDQDTRSVPPCLRERSVPDLGTPPVPTAHYTCPDLFKRSIDKMWMKTWQMACREEEIPNVGDFYVYEVVGKSLIIVRSSPTEIKALHNSCLHRGRRLVGNTGTRKKFVCGFHGMSWNVDGSFAHNPFAWDFPQCPASKMSLPEARVARWGGFVFVNFDPDARPLEDTLGPIPRYFERWHFEDKYIAAHFGKRSKSNWQVASEAFMETHHSITTHPQILPYVTDANAQYDIFTDHVSRHISGRGVQSPTSLKDRVLTEDEISTAFFTQGSRRGQSNAHIDPKVPEGMTARSYIAEMARQNIAKESGYDMSGAADCELGDSLIHTVFPNLSLWGGHLPNSVYRFRPVGTQHNECLMEIYVLKRIPKGAERPKPAPFHLLADDEPWASATEMGGLGAVVDQDWTNMEEVQRGMEASATGVVELGHYLEMRIRKYHELLENYLQA